MGTKIHIAINAWLNNGSKIIFKPFAQGLYQYALGKNEQIDDTWVLLTMHNKPPSTSTSCNRINTVTNCAKNCTKRQIHDTQLARKLKNINMCPRSQKFTIFCLSHLKDFSIIPTHIHYANNIFGKNTDSLKGKTVCHPTTRVQSSIDPVLRWILQLSFCNIHFGTVAALKNRQTTMFIATLYSVVQSYHHCRFLVTAILTDNKFEPICSQFPTLSTCTANKHVPNVKQYTQTIKDTTQSTYHMLPYN